MMGSSKKCHGVLGIIVIRHRAARVAFSCQATHGRQDLSSSEGKSQAAVGSSAECAQKGLTEHGLSSGVGAVADESCRAGAGHGGQVALFACTVRQRSIRTRPWGVEAFVRMGTACSLPHFRAPRRHSDMHK